jgi:hypothetical protein
MSEFPLEFSDKIGEVAKALAAAQGEIKDASKDATNPHFKNKYATLSSVRAAITPAFSKNSLAVTQYFEPHGKDGVCVVTLLAHSSGEWIKSKLFLPVTKADAQGFGSAISYARRYALAAIANVASDDDDDAEVAVKAAPAKAPPTTGGPDVASLEKEIASSNNAEELAAVSAKVGAIVGKIDPKDRDRLRAARDNRVRELAQAS